MKLPSVAALETSEKRRELASAKYRYGTLYGALAGLVFACAVWGLDALFLSQAHVLFPWLKLIVGVFPCVGFGALAGRLVARLDKTVWSILVWLAVLALFTWLSLIIPFVIAPRLVVWLKPDLKGALDFVYYPAFQYQFGATLIWASLFGLITGLVQLPLTESAVFSNSWLGKVAPLLVPLILMVVAGSWIDTSDNKSLRSSLVNLDRAIQYTLDHRGQAIDSQTNQDLHLYALGSVTDLLDRPRWLTVRSYNSNLDDVRVLVQFGDAQVNCEAVSEQPLFCARAAPAGP